jgi:hypothetical protein
MSTWPNDKSTKIEAVEELRSASFQRDGTLRKAVTTWAARLRDDGLGIRSTGTMKNIVALVALAAIVVTLVACSSNTTSGPNGSPSAIAEVAPSATALASPPATALASPPATAEVAPSAIADASPNVGTPITITIGDRTINATLNDSEVARDFVAMLPVTLPWFRNFGIEYITELDAPLTETGPFYTDVQAGDIVYYNPLDSITIIYKPTSSVPTLAKMGEITSDLSVFENLPENVDMRIEAR